MKYLLAFCILSLSLYTCNPNGKTPNKAPERSGGISKPTPKDTVKVDTLKKQLDN